MVRVWWLAYRLLTWLVWLFGFLVMPWFRWRKPKRAHWLLSRLWPAPLTAQPLIWLHAVSLGECRIAMALVRQLRPELGNGVMITTTTNSGLDYLQDQRLAMPARLLPWDCGPLYRRFWKGWQVPPTILVETEIWPGLFRFVTRSKQRLVIINGRLSSKTMKWQNQPLLRATMSQVYAIAARNADDRDKFEALGVEPAKIRLTGNMKFDFLRPQPPRDELATWLADSQPLLIYASISTDEAELLVPSVAALLEAIPRLRVIWAPRHLQDIDSHKLHLAALTPVLRSELLGNPRLVLLDTFGELAGCFSFAEIALVGGSFNRRGGQNFLECLQVGTPALVGPSVENFRNEAREAVRAGALLQVESHKQVEPCIRELLNRPKELKERAICAESFIEQHKGAIARTLKHLVDWGIIEPEGSTHFSPEVP